MHCCRGKASLLSGLVTFVLMLVLVGLAGCVEKKRCYHQCYEPALEGYGDSCGFTEDLTLEECKTLAVGCTSQTPEEEQRRLRRSWGHAPSYCSQDSE